MQLGNATLTVTVLEAVVKLVEMGSYSTATEVRNIARQVVFAFRQWTSSVAVLQANHPVGDGAACLSSCLLVCLRGSPIPRALSATLCLPHVCMMACPCIAPPCAFCRRRSTS